jgi:predicted nucleotidyltransferase
MVISHSTIKEELSTIEKKYQVTILYACESGSRAWGFPSQDSDYDVRFIYVHPYEKYISIEKIKETIDIPINNELDINGWDLKKALQLFSKSNCAIIEWFQSPIIYQANSFFHQSIWNLIPIYFSSKIALRHYLSITYNSLNYIKENKKVSLKKYFYTLRSLLSSKWIINNQTAPPIEFQKLSFLLNNSEVEKIINELLIQKEKSTEKDQIARIKVLDIFIEKEYELCENNFSFKENENNPALLNNLFKNTISNTSF